MTESKGDERMLSHWPAGVVPVTFDEVGLLGINPKTGRLHWDGKELVTKTKISLKMPELVAAFLVAVATFGGFLLQIYRTFWLQM